MARQTAPARVNIGIPPLSHPFSAVRLLRGVMAFARNRPTWVLGMYHDDHTDLETFFRWVGVHALIIHCNDAKPQAAKAAAAINVPTVNVLHDAQTSPWPSVMLDDREIGRSGARYLLELGFTRLAFFGVETLWSREREEGFLEVAAQKGIPVMCSPKGDDPTARPNWTDLEITDFARKWVAKLKPPIAVMCMNDGWAQRIAKRCRERGLRVPEDVAILGVDNDEAAAIYGQFPVSTIDCDLERVGFEAAQLLDAIMAGRRTGPTPRLIPPGRLIERQSTNVVALSDPDLAAAQRYINAHACEGITVQDVADHVAISRRMLELHFKQTLGVSPGERIRELRLRRAADLLRTTAHPVSIIAAMAGFEHRTNFATAFQNHFGMTPRQYRQKLAPGSLS